MSRSNRRASRPLIAFLALLVMVGSGSIIYKLSRASAARPQATAAATADASGGAAAATEPSASADVPPTPVSNAPLLPTTRPNDAAQATLAAAGPTTLPSPTHAQLASEMITGPTTAPSASLLVEAQAKIDSGNLLAARTRLNDALESGQLSDSQAASVKAMLSQISQTVVFGHQRFPDDPYGGTYIVESGDSMAKIAAMYDMTWGMLSRINGIDPQHLRSGATIKVLQGPFFAVVEKKKFTMDIYLGGFPGERSAMYVTTYRVGLGKDDSTPVGMWAIEPHHKLKHPTYYSPRGEGVIAADDPKNPLGGYWIGLTGTQGQAVGKMSYGIHGTNDQASIGTQSSMGCIRMAAADIPVVYDMMTEGKSMVLVKE